MEIIKISFDPTEIWNHGDFRHLITNINNGFYDDSRFKYELWIITTNNSLPYINALADQLKIPTERTLMCLNESSKVGLITLNTDIHFDSEYTVIHALEPTKVKGIFVDRKIAYPAMGLKYIQDLDKWTAIILRERNNGEKVQNC